MKYIYDFCQVDFCTRETSNSSKDAMYCKFHQVAYERTGDPLEFDNAPTHCSVEDCNSPHKRRGLCNRHYLRLKKYGSAVPVPKPEHCSVEGCLKGRYVKGLCTAHYQRWLSKGNIGSVEVLEYDYKICLVPNCSRVSGLKTSLICSAHRQTIKKYNISESKYLEFMNSNCSACGSSESLVVDHDHACCPSNTSCGECVRGVICDRCNKVLGSVGDNVEVLLGLAAYLNSIKV